MRFPIFLNYNQDELPIGYVEFTEEIPDSAIQNGAIVPYIKAKGQPPEYETIGFGLVPRQTVDTERAYIASPEQKDSA